MLTTLQWLVFWLLVVLCLSFAPGHAVTIEWDYDYENPVHEGFDIFRRKGGTGFLWEKIQRVDRHVRRYTDQDDGTLYCYYVRAYAGTRVSLRSNIACMEVHTPQDVILQRYTNE